ncbi:MAG: glycosyltransferase [Planctomycetes bacterium]|nr:glycosyltransferase [Planctomycetota bacterium]
MRILFVHQNMPGQYKHLARAIAADRANQAVFITKAVRIDIPGVENIVYKTAREAGANGHHYLRSLEDQVLHGQAVARVGLNLRSKGFIPEIICVHTGWGEGLFIRDVFPESRILAFCEFYYRGRGADVSFDPLNPVDIDGLCRSRIRNAHMLTSMEAMDWGVTPTRWQWSQHPEALRPRISIIHEGVDTELCRPNPAASLMLPTGRALTRQDEVVTYIVRNLEPYRGFHVFMPAVEEICRRRPKAHIVIVGGDQISYGRPPGDGSAHWREKLLSQSCLDPQRVHFLGRIPYEQFLTVCQISRAHVYLTYPFVLSWSMLESMSCGGLIIGSNTAPVAEVIDDGKNGMLVDFFDTRGIADRVDAALDHVDGMANLRQSARQTVIDRYDLRSVCLPAQLALIDDVRQGRRPASAPLS